MKLSEAPLLPAYCSFHGNFWQSGESVLNRGCILFRTYTVFIPIAFFFQSSEELKKKPFPFSNALLFYSWVTPPSKNNNNNNPSFWLYLMQNSNIAVYCIAFLSSGILKE